MPSVRIKRGYSTLSQDSPLLPTTEPPSTSRPRSRSLAHIFGPSISRNYEDDVPELPPLRLRPQAVSEGGITAQGSLPRRMSRVHSHIMSSTRAAASSSGGLMHRASSILSDVGRSLSLASHDRASMVSLEGRQENLLVPLDPEHASGRIGSALSFHSVSSTDFSDEHHHDDIVEHLDVIGENPFFSLNRICSSSCIDPQVATVSTLTNAANSIVMYVQSCMCILNDSYNSPCQPPTIILLSETCSYSRHSSTSCQKRRS